MFCNEYYICNVKYLGYNDIAKFSEMYLPGIKAGAIAYLCVYEYIYIYYIGTYKYDICLNIMFQECSRLIP